MTLLLAWACSLAGLLAALAGATTSPTAGPQPLALSEEQSWATFISEHGRSYPSAAEEAHRRTVFADNLRFIQRENAVPGRTYTLGVTPFADWTHEEFVAQLQTVSASEMHAAAPPVDEELKRFEGTIPDEVDWVAAGAVTGVKNRARIAAVLASSAICLCASLA